MRFVVSIAVLTLLLGGWQFASAHEFTVGKLLVEHPWARASIGPARSGVVYVTLINNGEQPDRLLSASTPVAARAAVHTHINQDGVMKMRPVGVLEVAPGEPTVFEPGGLHIMLMGLKAPLQEGTLFSLFLEFEAAGQVEVLVLVQEAAAMEPENAPASGGHKHGGSS
jgi:hypothetical protein